MSKVMEMMERMMAGMMKPEDMLAMIHAMIGRMFSSMSTEDPHATVLRAGLSRCVRTKEP